MKSPPPSSRKPPDRLCVELDPRRLEALRQGNRFDSLDVREVLRRRQLPALLVNLLLAGYQRRIGDELGVVPGSELLAAVEGAEAREIPVSLVDRDLGITLRRASRAMSWWTRAQLGASLLASLFERPELGEDELREMRRSDALNQVLGELGDAFPGLKRVIIDERDRYLCEGIRRAPGAKILAVVGAGHVAGIEALLRSAETVDREALEALPERRVGLRWLGWAIPLAILAVLGWIAVDQGREAAAAGARYWFLANAIPAALGAALALGHPGTCASAFFAAPFTSLTPVIGAGYVSAFVQSWLRPPRVRELASAVEEATQARAWWRNRLLRILLVFVLTTLGSLLGSALGATELLSRVI